MHGECELQRIQRLIRDSGERRSKRKIRRNGGKGRAIMRCEGANPEEIRAVYNTRMVGKGTGREGRRSRTVI